MKITVLSVPDCPNAALMRGRVDAALDGVHATVRERIVTTARQAERWGMAGSPTVLIDGVDPFATGAPAAISCRLYRTSSGGVAGVPDHEQVRSPIQTAAR